MQAQPQLTLAPSFDITASPRGLLRVTGTLALSQFWPSGESDADTAHLLLEQAAFAYRPAGADDFQLTDAFADAVVRGRSGSKPAIHKAGVTLRLQAVDAPELHYRPQALKEPGKTVSAARRAALKTVNGNFRQAYGERAAYELGTYLRALSASGTSLEVEVYSEAESPNDVFDTYGRLIGEILVLRGGGRPLSVNAWLAGSGWAFPTFYNSMSAEEITSYRQLAAVARKARAGLWAEATRQPAFDPQLVFEKGHDDFAPGSDHGRVMMPKLFRRYSTWSVNKRAGIIAGSFSSYLQRFPDACYRTDEFLEQGATASTPHRLDEYFDGTAFTVDADQLVFHEAPSRLVDSGSGKLITEW